ncbi:hypothetical protein BN1723_019136, partial [Verticillium longisporum]
MAASQGGVRQQLIPVLQRILHFDFPDKWPNFMDYTTELLNTNNAPSVLAGLQCLLAICRAWRFRSSDNESRVHFDKIIELSFPRLLTICNELVTQESDEAGEMLHLALKAYKHATWLELSAFLRQQQNNIAWCTVFLNTVSKAIPASAMVEDSFDREKHHWWKAKKWAYFNLNRLFIRQSRVPRMRDVFVDIGDKSWGVTVCQNWFASRGGAAAGEPIRGENTLHVGDQFLSAGSNDFK